MTDALPEGQKRRQRGGRAPASHTKSPAPRRETRHALGGRSEKGRGRRRRGSPHPLRASVSGFPERWRRGRPAAPHPSPAVIRAATPAVQRPAVEAEWLRDEDKKGPRKTSLEEALKKKSTWREKGEKK